MTLAPTDVSVAVCTYRRHQLAHTLDSLAALTLPPTYRLKIIIADNDEAPSAQIIVASKAAERSLDITYLHAPAHNISRARNACLAAAENGLLAFLDDDEFASPDWLRHLLEQQEKTGADIVLGPVLGVYHTPCPRWMVQGQFHSTFPVFVHGKIITGYTGNVLINLASPFLAGKQFDEALGITGGEDTDFFTRAHRSGARIEYAPEAVVLESVPPERATLSWLKNRHARFGYTHAQQLLKENQNAQRLALIATIKAIVCYGMMLLTLPLAIVWRRWYLRAMLHRAVASHLRSTVSHAR